MSKPQHTWAENESRNMYNFPSPMTISDVSKLNKSFTGHKDDTWHCPNCKRPHPGYHSELIIADLELRGSRLLRTTRRMVKRNDRFTMRGIVIRNILGFLNYSFSAQKNRCPSWAPRTGEKNGA